jgi:hypothetical protein
MLNFDLLGSPIGDAQYSTDFVRQKVIERCRVAWGALVGEEMDSHVAYCLLTIVWYGTNY